MLSEEELLEIRTGLENSQNPLFLFDNDVDGFCAFLVLRRAIERGRGVAIKSYPDLKGQYLRKVDEFNSDAIFILDKADVSLEFLKGANERNVLVYWIDHHNVEIDEERKSLVRYFSSFPSAEPTTFIAQSVFNRKNDLWLAMIGCIGDVYMPSFAKDFEESNPEFFNASLSAFEALHKTEIGKMVRMINFGLMDTITNVVNFTKYLFKANGPYDLLEENKDTFQFHKRYSELNKFFTKQIEKAESEFDFKSKVLFFSYSGEISMSSEIANKLYFNHPEKLIVVAFKSSEKVNLSIRGKNALKITVDAIKGIDGATGGGHEVATGAMVPLIYFEDFKKKIMEIV